MVLVQQLTGAGVGVKLSHDDKETTWENHGWISIKKLDGTEMVRVEDFQHNRCYREMESRAAECAQTVLAQFESEAEAEKAPPKAQGAQGSAQGQDQEQEQLDQAAAA